MTMQYADIDGRPLTDLRGTADKVNYLGVYISNSNIFIFEIGVYLRLNWGLPQVKLGFTSG